MESTTEDFLRPQDVAALLQVPVRTVYGWRSSGDGPPGFRVGRHLRYRRSEVEAWIERQERQR